MYKYFNIRITNPSIQVRDAQSLTSRTGGFDAHYIGMLYRHLGSEGTLGNIGDNQNDNNNSFHGTSYMSDQNYTGYTDKIYRMSGCTLTPLIDYIYTNSPTLNSNSSISNCSPLQDAQFYALTIQNNPGAAIYNCPIIQISGDDGSGDESIDENAALLVAQNNIYYPEYQDVAKWFDERHVYEGLDDDIVLRNSSTILSNFYSNQQLESTDEILATNKSFLSIIDSTITTDSSTIQQRILNAQTNNNLISTSRLFEDNEQTINNYYLRWMTKGINDFSSTEQNEIIALALSCPYINGTSVYRARMMYSEINPLFDYNDLALCNAAGVYKNNTGGGIFDDENNGLNAMFNSINNSKHQNIILGESMFKIYPNPASTFITIAYELNKSEKGEVVFYDMIGREKIRLQLSSMSNHLLININYFMQGIYTYKYFVNNRIKSTGKITIE